MSFRYQGRFTLLVLAAGLVPVVLKQSKPLAKAVGDTLVKAGEALKKMSEAPDTPETTTASSSAEVVEAEVVVEPGTPVDEATPNEDVNTDKTTKVGAGTDDVAMETASPYAHEEVSAQIAAEAMAEGDGAATEEPMSQEPPEAQMRTHDQQRESKPVEPDQPINPRRQTNSRPD
jgi:hypothetical protein